MISCFKGFGVEKHLPNFERLKKSSQLSTAYVPFDAEVKSINSNQSIKNEEGQTNAKSKSIDLENLLHKMLKYLKMIASC